MGSRITTIEKAQDTVLAQFNVDKQRTNTFLEEQIKLSKIKNEKFELIRKIKSKKDLYKLNTDTKHKLEIQKEIDKLEREKYLIENIKNYKNYNCNEAILKFFDLFDLIYFTQENIKSKDFENVMFYEDDSNSLIFKGFKCFKNKIVVTLGLNYFKEVFTKSDDYEETKKVVKAVKEFNVDLSIDCEYGDYEVFRNSFITNIIKDGLKEKYEVFKPKQDGIIKKDLWSFNF